MALLCMLIENITLSDSTHACMYTHHKPVAACRLPVHWSRTREIGMCLCGDNHCHVYTSTEGRKLSSPRHFKMKKELCRLLFSTKKMLPWQI